MKNIKMSNNNNGNIPTFENNCAMCFACMHYCPQQAIRLKFMSKKKKNYQYHHPDITAKAFIDTDS